MFDTTVGHFTRWEMKHVHNTQTVAQTSLPQAPLLLLLSVLGSLSLVLSTRIIGSIILFCRVILIKIIFLQPHYITLNCYAVNSTARFKSLNGCQRNRFVSGRNSSLRLRQYQFPGLRC